MTGKVRTELSREWLAHALCAEQDEIPEDVQVVGLEYHAERDLYEVVLESPELDSVLEGARVPYLHEYTNDE